MKLQQLRYLSAVVSNDLNVSTAARRLHTSQPAISKQIRVLERELGVHIFVRAGRQLTGITAAGARVVERAQRVVHEAQQLKQIGRLRDSNDGVLSVGTTHTQARYVLPQIIQRFRASHAGVQIQLHVGTGEQIADMARSERIDFAIATGTTELLSNWVLLPLYRWYRCIIVPQGHPLTRHARPTLAELARYPLITYSFSVSGPSSLLDAFARAGVEAEIALTARDADVIKTYVRLGLGVGIVAEMAMDETADADLVRIDASHLLPLHQTWVGFSRNAVMRRYMYDFAAALAPHLEAHAVAAAQRCTSQAQVDALFADSPVPLRRSGTS
ncbi:MAG TPA: LysR substrate-binding domain-containing protein [Steroidobacteraceae bacterium]|jgi:LysR family cys regulon transcriptional activator|nr:LysR substrate-binding domain-containing protein [Steroidobacteraceae bacterium]